MYVKQRAMLLTPLECGVYISSFDISTIGTKLGVELTKESRAEMFDELCTKVLKDSQQESLLKHIKEIIDERLSRYEKLKRAYKESSKLIDNWVERAQRAKDGL